MNAGIRSHMGNHRIERLHNSMWEREKVMRHLKKAKSAEKILKAYRAYYNFVRPHMALENHTPAEIATVPIQLGTNGRLDILRQAARNQQRNKKRICLSRIFFLRAFESEIKPETGNVNLTPEGQVANTVTLSAFRL